MLVQGRLGENFLLSVKAPAPPAHDPGCGRAQAPVLAGVSHRQSAWRGCCLTAREPVPLTIEISASARTLRVRVS